MKHKVKYAGIVVSTIGNFKKLSFHSSGAKGRPIGIWIKLPSKTQFNFVKLPRTLSKQNAARYLMQHPNFKLPMYQRFLKDYIERKTKNQPINPRQRIPVRRNITPLPQESSSIEAA